jgi:hypothetical protein
LWRGMPWPELKQADRLIPADRLCQPAHCTAWSAVYTTAVIPIVLSSAYILTPWCGVLCHAVCCAVLCCAVLCCVHQARLSVLESTAEGCRAQALRVEADAARRAERLKWLGGRSSAAAAADAQQVWLCVLSSECVLLLGCCWHGVFLGCSCGSSSSSSSSSKRTTGEDCVGCAGIVGPTAGSGSSHSAAHTPPAHLLSQL